jgi:exodeoxyribonuclease X
MNMPFGKHKGEPLEDIPTDYLNWALAEATLSDDLVEEMEAQLAMRRGEGVLRRRS